MSNGSNLTRLGFEIYPLPFAVGNLALSLFGSIGNASVIAAFALTPTLRSKCARLMAALAVADFFTCLMFAQFSTMILLGYTFIDNFTCFVLLSPGLFAMNAESFLVLMVGIDRLLCIRMPVQYKVWNKDVYLALMIPPALLYAAVVVVIGYHATSHVVIVPVCVPPTAYLSPGQETWASSAVAISVLVLVVYMIAYCFAKNTGNGAEDVTKRRLLTSLALVGAIYTCSWMLTMLVVMSVQLLRIRPTLVFHISLYVGYLADINASCNPVLYIWRSNEWRAAILTRVWHFSSGPGLNTVSSKRTPQPSKSNVVV